MHLADDLALPLDAITQTFGVLAVRGAGKSNLGAAMAEEMFKAGLPFVAIDPVGSWWGLRSSGDGAGPGLPIPIFGGRHGDVPLEKTGGQLVADLVVDNRMTCVIDVSEFSEGEKITFLIDFAERLYRRNTEPLHLFLEEADDFIPQRPFREQARLLRAWENIVRRGRARGLGITMITQRSASLNKNVLTQIETLFVLRTTSPQDRKAISLWVQYHGQAEELLESLPSLESGEAWIWSPSWLKKTARVRVRRRSTFDSGATPKDARGSKKPATLADVDLDSVKTRMTDTIERAKENDPRELKKKIAELQRQAKQKPAAAPTSQRDLDALMEKAKKAVAQVYEQKLRDMNTRVDRLGKMFAKAFAIHEQIAGELLAKDAKPITTPTAASLIVCDDRPVLRRPIPRDIPKRTPTSSNGHVTGAQQRILNALAELEQLGLTQAEKTQLALFAKASPTSSSYANNLGALRTAGLIDYPAGGFAHLTADGRAIADSSAAPADSEELHRFCYSLVGPAKSRILAALIDAYPDAIGKDDLAEKAEASATSSSFANNLGSLRSLGLIDYPAPGKAVALPVLFMEGSRG